MPSRRIAPHAALPSTDNPRVAGMSCFGLGLPLELPVIVATLVVAILS
jgi:hypothetical protein